MQKQISDEKRSGIYVLAVDDYLYRVGTLKGNWIFLPQDEQKLSKYDDRYVIVNYDLSPAGNCWKQTWLLKQIQENRQEIRHLNKILQNNNCKALH